MTQKSLAKADEMDLADRCFVEFVLSDTNGDNEIEYTQKPLYDETLQISGRQYDFTVSGVDGYALLAEIKDAVYEVEELFYNRQSPFDDCQGLPVYISRSLYLDYKDGAFYNVLTDSQVSNDYVLAAAGNGFGYQESTDYQGGANFTLYTQTVNYSTKSTAEYSIQYDLPNYYGSTGSTSRHYYIVTKQ